MNTIVTIGQGQSGAGCGTAQGSPAGVGGGAELAVARWVELEEEMALLCRGLEGSWCDRLGAVTTLVRLPDGPEYAGALTSLCRRQAGAFELRCAVARRDDQWEVRFSRPPGGEGRSGGEGERSWVRANRALSAYLAGAYQAARRLHGARLHR